VLESIGPFLTAVKNAGPKLYAAALAACLLIIFLPDSVIAQIGLVQFKQQNRMYIGLALIGSASLLATHILAPPLFHIGVQIETWRLNRRTYRTLIELTEEEKAFLRPFIYDGENTRYASIYDGITKGLELKQLTYRASNIGVPGGFEFPYNLQPIARRLLNAQPQLLDKTPTRRLL